MKLEVVKMTLGPMSNNVYLLADSVTREAVVIDPTFGSQAVIDEVNQKGWTLQQIWLTHAHFDHIAGVNEITNYFDPPLPIGLHPADEEMYQQGGGAIYFGMSISQPSPISIHFIHNLKLYFHQGDEWLAEVRHTPGHSPGHVMFYCQSLGVLFCGDVIFRRSIGRADLPGGNLQTLFDSIQCEVLSLPDDTRLLPGHGPESTVGFERDQNPFLH